MRPGTDGASAYRSGTHALEAGELAQLTDGQVYEWRIQIRGDNETYNTYLRLWQIGLLAAIADWPSAPTFTEDGVPDAADFNTIKTASEKLADFVPAINWCGGGEPVREESHLVGTVQRGDPHGREPAMRGGIGSGMATRLARCAGRAGGDTAGNEATVYESGDLPTTGGTEEQSQEIDRRRGGARWRRRDHPDGGEPYRVTIRMRRTVGSDAEVLDVYGGMVIDQRRHAGRPWVTPNRWAHLDDDVGPTHLNAYWTI